MKVSPISVWTVDDDNNVTMEAMSTYMGVAYCLGVSPSSTTPTIISIVIILIL